MIGHMPTYVIAIPCFRTRSAILSTAKNCLLEIEIEIHRTHCIENEYCGVVPYMSKRYLKPDSICYQLPIIC